MLNKIAVCIGLLLMLTSISGAYHLEYYDYDPDDSYYEVERNGKTTRIGKDYGFRRDAKSKWANDWYDDEYEQAMDEIDAEDYADEEAFSEYLDDCDDYYDDKTSYSKPHKDKSYYDSAKDWVNDHADSLSIGFGIAGLTSLGLASYL